MKAAPHTVCHVAFSGGMARVRSLSGRRIADSPIPRCSWDQLDPPGSERKDIHHAIHHPCQVTADPARRLRARRIRGARGNRSDVVRELRAKLRHGIPTCVPFGLYIGNHGVGVVAHGGASGDRRHGKRAACCHLRPSLGNVVDQRSVRVGTRAPRQLHVLRAESRASGLRQGGVAVGADVVCVHLLRRNRRVGFRPQLRRSQYHAAR